MTIQDTVIPSSFDSSSTDGDYVTVDSNGKVTLGAEYFNEQAEQQIEIIELQANATITPVDHNSTISDTFSDSDGYLDSVDGSSTANFSTDRYNALNSALESYWADGNLDSGHDGSLSGIKFTMNSGAILKSCDVSGANCTSVQLQSSAGSLLATSTSVAGGTAYFDDYTLVSGTTYYLKASGGNHRYYKDVSLPIAGTVANCIAGFSGSDNGTRVYTVRGISFATSSSSTIVITLPTITGSVVATQLVLNDPERETGDSITYELTDGSNTDSSLTTDTKNSIVNLTSNPTTMTINLTPKSSSPTAGYPSVKTYCLKVWKA